MMRCHYEVLSIERDAESIQIRKAFHKAALKWHPDKHQNNNISPEEATLKFQEIQNAYEVLSDPHEKKWYDEHREQILRGEDGNDQDQEDLNDLNLWKYFSPSIYTGYQDDEKGFYHVYQTLFQQIDTLDREACVGNPTTTTSLPEAPFFGTSTSSFETITSFYQYWKAYVTQRSFSWLDEYKITNALSRQIRRAMEKENKKLRDFGKKKFTNQVRELIDFIQKRDQRYQFFIKEKKNIQQQQQQQQQQKQKQKQKQQPSVIVIQQQDFEEKETSFFAELHIQEEMKKFHQKLNAEIFICEICNKKQFKSTKQLQNHFQSKKHLEKQIALGIVPLEEEDLEQDDLEQEDLEQEKEEDLQEILTDDFLMDLEIQTELAKMKKSSKKNKEKQDDSIHTDNTATTGITINTTTGITTTTSTTNVTSTTTISNTAAEEVRLEKELKAAEKRKERKEQRKQKRQMDVANIKEKAKKKQEEQEKEQEQEQEERKNRKGKRKTGKTK